ncbi:MAG: NIPSNAP family protein [Novosphingobium sp.]
MEHAPVHIVDTSIIPRELHDRFLTLVRDEIVPAMTEAGAECLSVLASSPDIGEDVQVQVTWKVANHSAWNVVRKNFFLDPRWHAASEASAGMRVSGQRRFLYPAN